MAPSVVDSTKVISFHSIRANAVVRVHPDGKHLCIYELLEICSGKSATARSQEWAKLKKYPEIKKSLIEYKFRGERYTSMITFAGALKVVMLMTGHFAASCRTSFVQLLMRYAEGDESLHAEVEANRGSGVCCGFQMIAGNMKVDSKQYQHAVPEIRYVYATESDAFPGLIKIGKATDVRTRLTSMNTSCAPMPHRVVAICPTLDYDRDESEAHGYFGARRCEGEFFALSHSEVSSFFSLYLFPRYQAEMARKVNAGTNMV